MRIYAAVFIDVVGTCTLHHMYCLITDSSYLANLFTNSSMTVLGMQVDSHSAFSAKPIPQVINSQMEESRIQHLVNKTQAVSPQSLSMMRDMIKAQVEMLVVGPATQRLAYCWWPRDVQAPSC